MLVPGRGLRRAPLGEMARNVGAGGFAIAAEIEDIKIGTGALASAPNRRKVRINGANQSVNSLAEWLAIVWMTPAMDRLFLDGAGGRRRFLDRLVLALIPAHARASSQYEQAMRQRNKLLSDDRDPDPAWLDALEKAMAENGTIIRANRKMLAGYLQEYLAEMDDNPFAVPLMNLHDSDIDDPLHLAQLWRSERPRDRAAGRSLSGPHRADLIVHHRGTGQAAASCSTGEQKALLLSIIQAHAALVTKMRDEAPIILLDEVAAHLDPLRRAALFERLSDTGCQIWMTGTEAELFSSIAATGQFVAVDQGQIRW